MTAKNINYERSGTYEKSYTNSLAHTTWECKYHIVLAPKFRRKEIYGTLRREIGMILRELCRRKEVEVMLDKKLFEEAHEFIEEHNTEELADLMEVIFAIMKDKNISIEDIETARQIKNSKKGSFNDRIYLIDVEQESIDEREENELKKEWRKNT